MTDDIPAPPWVMEDQCHFAHNSGVKLLQPGDTVEFEEDRISVDRDHDFLRIHSIRHNLITGQIILRGWCFRRTVKFNGLLPAKLNEVSLIVDVLEGDRDLPILPLGLKSIQLFQIVRKRKLIVTNAQFPTFSFREHTFYSSDAHNATEVRSSIENYSELVARWVSISYYPTAAERYNRRTSEACFRQLRPEELRDITAKERQENPTIMPKTLIREWRGVSPQPEITFGDMFCGAGGVSQGAADAGLRLALACDNDPAAISTYHINRPDVDVLHMDVQHLPTIRDDLVVDVLHISPPCQPYSPANTGVYRRHHDSIGGRRDEVNQSALFTIPELLEKCKPRVVTRKFWPR